MSVLDLRAERENFPTLLERTYFASQSFGPYPREMLDDLRDYERSLSLRNRGIALWAERWEEMHRLTEQLLDAPRGSIFFRDSATAVQAAIAASIEPKAERRRIVVASGDFHSSRYLWHGQSARGFEIVEVESRGIAHSDPEPFVKAIDERVAIVALSLVSPRSGGLLDAPAIIDRAHRVGAIVIIDCYQALGVLPIHVTQLGADVVVGGFHKWVGAGGTGLAFGYVTPELSAKLEPVYPGWMGHADLMGFRDQFEPAHNAEKFQQGMPALEPVYTARAGIRWVLRVGIDRIRARSLELTQHVIERAQSRRMTITTPLAPGSRGGTICLDVAGGSEIASELSEMGIDVDFRPGAGIRLGPHATASEDECDVVLDEIHARLR